MSTAFRVPLVPSAQRFSVFLSNVQYVLEAKWNTISNCWVLDILDQNGTPVLCGVPLITGADLLAQFEYLDIGGAMIVQTDNAPESVPTYENLGSTGNLYYVVRS